MIEIALYVDGELVFRAAVDDKAWGNNRRLGGFIRARYAWLTKKEED